MNTLLIIKAHTYSQDEKLAEVYNVNHDFSKQPHEMACIQQIFQLFYLSVYDSQSFMLCIIASEISN